MSHNETGKECDTFGYSQVFLSQRAYYWNAIPQTAIDAKSINQFKRQLKIHLNNIIMGYTNH